MATHTKILEPLAEMTATINVVVSINSITVMQDYWTAPLGGEIFFIINKMFHVKQN